MSESSETTSPSATDCNRLGIQVEEAEHAQFRDLFSLGPKDRAYIRKAVTSGNWIEASSYDPTYWVHTPLTMNGDIPLHIAVSMQHSSFVEKLVQLMSMQDMEIVNADGNTAFSMAVISGNMEITAILLNKNPGLVRIRGQKDHMLPIQLACKASHPHIVEFLCERISMDTLPSHQDIVLLFFLALNCNIYTVALKLLETYRELTTTTNEKGLTALEVLAQTSIDQKDSPVGYQEILNLLFKFMEEDFSNSEGTSKAMFDAAKSGNILILKLILEYNPNLLTKINGDGQSLLHVAILYRQAAIYRIIRSNGAYKFANMLQVDKEGNNVLHMAAKLVPQVKFGSLINQASILSEELWFEEVETRVPASLKTMQNGEGETPQELFHKEHQTLCERAISELNGMASNFLIVATLMTTLGITAGLSVPAAIEIEEGSIHKRIWYHTFLLSISIGICLSNVGIVLFISAILRSIWKQKSGYISSRLTRITIGHVLLCFALGIMSTFSCVSAALLFYGSSPKWIIYFVAALAVLPVILSYVIYSFSWPLLGHLVLAFCEIPALRLLSVFGIKWSPFYDEESVKSVTPTKYHKSDMAQSGAFTSSTTIDMLDPHGAYKRHVCMAATLGDWGKASSYDETQPNWVSTTLTRDGDTALHIAVSMEHIGFVEKLVERMSMQDLEIMDADGNTAFSMAAISGNVKLATILLGKNSGLLWLRGHKGMLPIQLAFSAGQPHMVNFLFEKTQSDDMDTHLSYQDIVNLFFLSLTYNNFTVASMLLKRYPEFAGVKNEKGLTAFEVLAQQISVYQLILSKGAYKNAIVHEVDKEGNNVLHLAGKLEAKGRFGSINHVLILSEELWFKEVEKIVPPGFKTMQNREKMTPKELFHEEHADLTDSAVSELNEMANNFLVVATLIVSLGITAALTIRTNNIQGKTPLFQDKIWYIIFLLSVGFGVITGALSIVFHTSAILRSTWKQKGYPVTSRLIRIISGDFMLCISMGVMITISCMTGVVLIYTFFPKWIFLLAAVFCVSPVILVFVVYVYVWPLKLVLLLALLERVTGGMFYRFGIRWTAFDYIG
ncbi:hypothetical protein AHAS_Ahas09G0266800 [Arachis hypogaea]